MKYQVRDTYAYISTYKLARLCDTKYILCFIGSVLTTLIDSVKDFTDIGIKPLQAKSLFAHVVEWKTKGLSLEAEVNGRIFRTLKIKKCPLKYTTF